MKTKTILLTTILLLSLLIAACGSKEPTETTVNLPVVGGEVQNTSEPQQAAEVPLPQDTYPVEQPVEPVLMDAAIAYPADDDSPTYDADMRAYIEQILNGTLAIEDLFGKDESYLRETLINAAEGRIILTESGLEKAVDWLKKQ
jgi:predicted small lipoprotein YifL